MAANNRIYIAPPLSFSFSVILAYYYSVYLHDLVAEYFYYEIYELVLFAVPSFAAVLVSVMVALLLGFDRNVMKWTLLASALGGVVPQTLYVVIVYSL